MAEHSLGRRSLLACGILTVGAIGLPAPAGAYSNDPTETPQAALDELMAGNQRFIKGSAEHPRQALHHLRPLVGGQRPFAIMLCCADSRVAPEILFDQGLGDIFDNRVAGNITDDLLLGSIEYGVDHFGSPLLMVLGHGNCGAITATIESIETGKRPPVHIDAVVQALRPVVEPILRQPGNKVDNAVTANVHAQVKGVVERSDIVRQAVRRNELAVIGARYDLENGEVILLR